MRTVQQQWATYIALVYPGQRLSPEQLREYEYSFYAGAQAVVQILWDISGNDVSEDAGLHILEGLQQELHGYAAQMLRDAGIHVPQQPAAEGAGNG